jgi:dihydrofolate synthase/folylpolyglutamate synthase
MRFERLQDWLQWQEQLHPQEIDLGLERVALVASRLGLDEPSCKVITVAGTNGKGSSLAMLESIYREAGYRVGLYTSPHLFEYNERIRINGRLIDDPSLCQAFAAIDEARAETSLSYFEFGTLAALWCFNQHELDIILLEVGLGGRLDAVNLVDADVALITSIDIDHVDWLGHDREVIGLEKAGIMRSGRPAIISDPEPPAQMLEFAQNLGAELMCLGVDYHFQRGSEDWSWAAGVNTLEHLAFPGLGGEFQFNNASGVLMAIQFLQRDLPVSVEVISLGLSQTRVMGRLMVVQERPRVLFDVAHNPQGARALSTYLAENPVQAATHVVIGIMADKDIHGLLDSLCTQVSSWHVCAPDVSRSMPSDQLKIAVGQVCGGEVNSYASVANAFDAALKVAAQEDQIVVMGSFFTVAEAWPDQYNAHL